jgi:methylated-DNA-[protein]-cysteine S-methyltransferase
LHFAIFNSQFAIEKHAQRTMKADRSSLPAPQAFAFLTDLGWLAIAYRGEQLAAVTMGHPSASAAIASLQTDAEWADTDRRDLPAPIAEVVDRFERYAAGEEVTFADVPLDLSHLTAFQQKVVKACRKIGRGRTKTYGELAVAAGAPGAARAVGSVMAKNRLPIIVPCHRVVGSGGSLGGFSAPTGLSLKQRMLALEGFEPARTKMKPRNTPKTRKGRKLAR